jgi:hypothetical protein
METKYLAFFEKVRKSAAAHGFKINGNRLLIEILPIEEIKTSGGLIMATKVDGWKSTTEENRPTIAIIHAVGTHHYDDVTETIQPGAAYPIGSILWINKMSPSYISVFPGLGSTEETLAWITDHPTDVHTSWPNMEAYLEFKKAVGAN